MPTDDLVYTVKGDLWSGPKDWIEYLDFAMDYAAPGIFNLQALPICASCDTNEVKPGEDECFDCLGEMPILKAIDYWIHGTGPGISAQPYSMNTIYVPASNNLIFTWDAPALAEVTGMTYSINNSYQNFHFDPIKVDSGDTIKFTVNDILKGSIIV